MRDLYYHTKPYLLLAGGIICILSDTNGGVAVGGLLLAGMGGLIWKMRSQRT